MSYNSIGKILKLTTWGESHGTEIGAVLDGVPSNIKITSYKDLDGLTVGVTGGTLEDLELTKRAPKGTKITRVWW